MHIKSLRVRAHRSFRVDEHVAPASRAPSSARIPVKRRYRCVWAGLLSVEIDMIQSVETVLIVEDNIRRAAMVRHGGALRRLRNQAHTYIPCRDLRGLQAAPRS